MLSHKSSTLDNTIKTLGYNTVEDFAREQAKSILAQKVAYYKSKIDLFEYKYSMNYQDFCSGFILFKDILLLIRKMIV